jgi:3-phosphoshikimate 1-carboxyvinyltransferase
MIARIEKKDKSVRGVIHLPPSKSIYNRALIIRALCGEDFKISPAASANDSLLLEKLLKSNASVIDAEDAGTTFRFLTAYLSQRPGEWLLTGTERMKQRPIEILVNSLRQLGADISYGEKKNFPPLKIRGKKLKGGRIDIDGSVSSQFISALLLIAPTLEGGLQLNLKGEVFSSSYIEMTLRLMKEFGVHSDWSGSVITVEEQKYFDKDFFVEADWSAASYWYEVAALSEEADITLVGLNENSVQGDSAISKIMEQFGVETEFIESGVRISKQSNVNTPKVFLYNFKSCPDLVQTMAVTCAALGTEAAMSGIENLRIKETNRLHALYIEFKKLGLETRITPSHFYLPGSSLHTVSNYKFETYDDHRMAMSLAPLALKLGVIEIENAEVVKKSYPEFWNDLSSAGFEVKLS